MSYKWECKNDFKHKQFCTVIFLETRTFSCSTKSNLTYTQNDVSVTIRRNVSIYTSSMHHTPFANTCEKECGLITRYYKPVKILNTSDFILFILTFGRMLAFE